MSDPIRPVDATASTPDPHTRPVSRLIPARATADGAGVKIRRSIGQSGFTRVDPFLMLDQFFSDQPEDYLAGFPAHPHRGFQTVTYMLDGHMLHEDHMGNHGHLKAGDVQWMIAGRGVIHSEMPQQKEGRMRGFQLWINLPAAEKMQPAAWQDIPASQMPWVTVADGVQIKTVAGSLQVGDQALAGPISGLSMAPLLMDVVIDAHRSITLPIADSHNAVLYLYEGAVDVADSAVPVDHAAVLGDGEQITIHARQPSRMLVLAGIPIAEPIAQYGPFVMNTMEEVDQALRDYRNGTLVTAHS